MVDFNYWKSGDFSPWSSSCTPLPLRLEEFPVESGEEFSVLVACLIQSGWDGKMTSEENWIFQIGLPLEELPTYLIGFDDPALPEECVIVVSL